LVFLAFVDDELVGHAVLTWDGAESPPMPRKIEACPNVSDVWVRPDWRRRGIGGSLLEACEHVVRDQGFPRVGLSVGVDNAAASALYRSLGYRDAGIPEYQESGRWVDANGGLVEWNETCRYMVRSLAEEPSP